MGLSIFQRILRTLGTGALIGIGLLLPAPLAGQAVVRDALAVFPADTSQIAYLNLAHLRTLPEYPQIRRRLLARQFLDFQEFLRAAGTDPEKDVDEVLLGWRGEATGRAAFFGLAQGRFDSARIQAFFVRYNLPHREYAGFNLYVFGSGEDPADFFFCFLSSSTAAFGRRRDIRDMLDVRNGAQPPLDSSAAFVGWSAELEGTAPQWGVVTGKAAANHAIAWLGAGGRLGMDPSVLGSTLRAFLYRVEWGAGLFTSVSVICRDAETARALGALVRAWRDSAPPLGSEVAAVVQGLDINTHDSRIDLSTSASLPALEQILRGPASPPSP